MTITTAAPTIDDHRATIYEKQRPTIIDAADGPGALPPIYPAPSSSSASANTDPTCRRRRLISIEQQQQHDFCMWALQQLQRSPYSTPASAPSPLAAGTLADDAAAHSPPPDGRGGDAERSVSRQTPLARNPTRANTDENCLLLWHQACPPEQRRSPSSFETVTPSGKAHSVLDDTQKSMASHGGGGALLGRPNMEPGQSGTSYPQPGTCFEACDGLPPKQQKGKRGRKPVDYSSTYCLHCGTSETPEWRRGPAGPRTLCNACGLQFAKKVKEAEQRPERRVPLSDLLNNTQTKYKQRRRRRQRKKRPRQDDDAGHMPSSSPTNDHYSTVMMPLASSQTFLE